MLIYFEYIHTHVQYGLVGLVADLDKFKVHSRINFCCDKVLNIFHILILVMLQCRNNEVQDALNFLQTQSLQIIFT